MTTISPSPHIYQSCAAHAFSICRICGFFSVTLDLDSAKLLAAVPVSSHLNCCNSFLHGIADIGTDLTKLQHIQSRLVHVVTKSPPFTRSVPLLYCLYWLPVKCRIFFKISLLTYKTLHDKIDCFSSLHVCSITPTLFTEIKQRN